MMRRTASQSSPQPASRARADTKKQRGAWGAACVGVVLAVMVTLIARAPAHWLARAVDDASGGRVQLHYAAGTLWRGSAQLVLNDPSVGTTRTLPTRLHWHIQPLHWRVQLHAACCMAAPIVLQGSKLGKNWAMTPADFDGPVQSAHTAWPALLWLPLSVLEGLGAPWNTLGLRGVAVLEVEQLAVDATTAQLSAHARVRLLDVATHLSTLPNVGSWALHYQSQSTSAAQLQLHTLRGPLHLQGAGHVDAAGQLHFLGTARSEVSAQAELANLLTLLGQRRADQAPDDLSVVLRLGRSG